MFTNYMALAIRSLFKNKLVSLINIGGLSIGLAFGIFAVIFAYNELTYDLFNVNVDRIYRIRVRMGDEFTSRTPWLLGPTIAHEFPDVEVVRVRPGRGSITHREKSFKVAVSYVDPSYFNVFSFPMAIGDASTALRDVRSIVITERVASKLFPRANPVGRMVTLYEKEEYIVTGVLSTFPENSSIVFDCLVAADSATESFDSWNFNIATTFVLVPKYLKPLDIEDRLPKVVHKGWGYQSTASMSLLMQPFKEVHFDQRTVGFERTSNPAYMGVFFGIALIVITISSVNYSALAIGRAISRKKEAGVRKLFGCHRRQLVCLYLVESVLLALLALIVGLALTGATLPTFSSLVVTKITLLGHLSVTTFLCLLLLTLAIGLMAGLYPALVFSRQQPVELLNARPENVMNSGFLLRLLLVIQFAMSMALVMGAFAMAAQLNLLVNRNPGFRSDGIVVIQSGGLRQISPGLVDAFESSILSLPNVISVGRSQHRLDNRSSFSGYATAEGKTIEDVEVIDVGYGFLKTLDIKLLEGRDFSRDISTDRRAVIINQALMKELGWRSANNKVVDWNGNGDAPIIGVVKDFSFKSFHHMVSPAIFCLRPEWGSRSFVRMASMEDRHTLETIRREWHKIAPWQSFRATFLKDELKNQYRKDEKWLNAIKLPAILTFGLACLGAFGLTSFSLAQRTKEIAIRKVYGTPIYRLMAHQSIDFVKIVILAAIFAGPITYLVLREWLQNFVYRIDLTTPIIMGAALTFAIVMVIVSCKTYKAASHNPANTLRDE